LEERSSEYDQLRSTVDAGQTKIDELTSEVLRLDVVKSELEGAVADLQAKLGRAARTESELAGRASWLQGIVDEQKGLIAGYKAEVADLSRNLSSVEIERNSARKELNDTQKLLVLMVNDKIEALEKENADLREREKSATDIAQRQIMKYREVVERERRYSHQLGLVHKVRNRTWIHGFEWGFETFRVIAMSEKLRDRVSTITIRDIEPDPQALNELKMFGVEELPDARGLWTVPPPIAVLRPAAGDDVGAGPSGSGGVPPGDGAGVEPGDSGGVPPS
jgi:hypothetical protein